MKHPVLTAQPRTILGKKVHRLRSEGMLPANIYGKALSSLAVQINAKEFADLYKAVGETGIIDIQVEGKNHPVLIKDVQRDVLSQTPLHADFYQVNLKEKLRTLVPVSLTGEAQAVTDKLGVLIQDLNDIEVEALPENLPERIEVDVTTLANLHEHISVVQLSAPDGVTLLAEPEVVVAHIGELMAEEPEEVAPAEETPEVPVVGEENAAEEASEAQEE